MYGVSPLPSEASNRSPVADRIDAPDLLRLGPALDVVLAVEARLDEPFDQPLGRIADQAPAFGRERLQPRREVDDVADRGQRGVVALDLRDHRHAAGDARAHHRLLAEALRELPAPAGEGGVDRHRRAARAQGVVFLRIGNAEHRHDAVAGVAADRSAMVADGAGQLVVHRADEGQGAFFAEPFDRRGKPGHVGEQHRDMASFRASRRSGPGNGVSVCHSLRPCSRHPGRHELIRRGRFAHGGKRLAHYAGHVKAETGMCTLPDEVARAFGQSDVFQVRTSLTSCAGP